MPREKKPQKIEDIIDPKTKETAPLHLNRNTLKFFADYQGEHFEHSEAAPVKAWLAARLQEARKLAWLPVILATSANDASHRHPIPHHIRTDNAKLEIHIERFWLGITPGRKLMRCQWELPIWHPLPVVPHLVRTAPDDNPPPQRPEPSQDEQRLAYAQPFTGIPLDPDGSLKLPVSTRSDSYFGSTKTYIAYSEQLWNGLTHLIEAINTLGAQIDQLLETTEGQTRLTEIGTHLLSLALPAGKSP